MQRVFEARKDIPKEETFGGFLSGVICDILTNSNKRQKRCQKICLEAQGTQDIFIETQLDELPCRRENTISKCRIFRRRMIPNLKDFQMQFMVQRRADDLDFPFFQLFFQYHELLQYVSYLPILLKWDFFSKQQLGQSIKRKQAKKRQDIMHSRRECFHGIFA